MRAFSALIGLAVGVLVGAWGLMILVGVLHHEWWEFIPTMSYRTAVMVELAVLMVAVVGALVGGAIRAVLDA